MRNEIHSPQNQRFCDKFLLKIYPFPPKCSEDIMEATSTVVKKTAKTVLKDNWVEAMAIGAIVLFVYFLGYIAVSLFSVVFPNMAVYGIITVLAVFVVLPLLLGALRCYWLVMWDKKSIVGEIFYYFASKTQYLKAIKMFWLLCLRALWIGALLLVPSVITDVLSSAKIYELFHFSAPSWASNLWVVSIFLKTLAGGILLAIMVKYYLAPFLIIADEQMDVREAIHKSTLLSKATGIDFVVLILSFIGWILLSLFIFPLVVTIPYFMVSYMVHSRFSVANYNKVVQQLGNIDSDMDFKSEGF